MISCIRSTCCALPRLGLGLIAVLMLVLPIAAQEATPPVLSEAVEAYYTAIKNKDFEVMLGRSHPVLFEIADKETMLAGMREQAEDPGGQTRVEHLQTSRIDGPVRWDGKEFALVHYTLKMFMAVKTDTMDGRAMTPEDQASSDELTLEMMKGMFGKDKVRFNPQTRELEVDQAASIYAILDPAMEGWLFLSKELVNKAVPEEVIRKLH